MNFGNLGIALGAGVDEWNNQRKMARDDAAESRAAETFKQQQEQYLRQKEMQAAQDAIMKKYAAYEDPISKGDYSFAPELLGKYNANDGAFSDGHYAIMQSTPNGQVVHFAGPNGQVVRSVDLNPQSARQLVQDAMMSELMFTSPELARSQYNANRDYSLKQGELGVKQDSNNIHRAHYERSDATTAQHYADWAAHQRAQLALQQGELSLKQRALNASAAASSFGQTQYLNGQDGGVVAVTPVRNKNGTVSYPATPLAGVGLTPKMSGEKPTRQLTEMSIADAQALSDHVNQATAMRAKADANFAKLLKADPAAARQQVISGLSDQYNELGVRVRGLGLPQAPQSTEMKMPPGYGAAQPPESAPPVRQQGLLDRFINSMDARAKQRAIDEEDRRSRLGL